jgi:hypothetical protein
VQNDEIDNSNAGDESCSGGEGQGPTEKEENAAPHVRSFEVGFVVIILSILFYLIVTLNFS